MNKTKALILLRGLPGSGKSTAAKLFQGNDRYAHYEADMYFMEDGEYKFDHTKLKDAHNWCRHSVMDAMKDDIPVIVVSNTFTQEWEMESYYLLSEEMGYQVTSLIVENRHEGKNIHGCSDAKIEVMKNRFEIKLI